MAVTSGNDPNAGAGRKLIQIAGQKLIHPAV
jgi:hypothetical protein